MAEPTFKRSKAAEDAAVERGIATRAEIEARGGINASGYYGDSYREGITLTDEEYAAAIQGAREAGKTGAGMGSSINTASQAKLANFYKSQGYTPEQIAGLTSGRLTINSAGNIISARNVNLADTETDTDTDTNTGFGAGGPGSQGYEDRKSAYDLLYQQFNEYGLGALVEPLKNLITEGVSPSEFTIRLRETDAYKKRFAANASRIAKGLRALSEAEYIGLEDQYQDVMRRYGLPETYYTRGDMGRQEGFEKFIGGDVSPVELEDRIQTAQRRVLNAPPQVKDTLTQYYGSDITNGDILAYMLDPTQAIENIKRKVTAAEIGAGAAISGLGATKARAEELGTFGVTGEQARAGFQTIAELLPGATKLGDIYAKQGLGPYTQTTAEQEVFGTTGAADAAQKRKRLAQLETAQFSGSTGAAGGALGRERAGQF